MSTLISRRSEWLRICPNDNKKIEYSNDQGRSWHVRYPGRQFVGTFSDLVDARTMVFGITEKGPYYSFDEGKSLHRQFMPKNIQGLSTLEKFEKIVVKDFIEPYNLISLCWGDIDKFCHQPGIFDALRIESSLETFGEDLTNGIKRIRTAHEGQELQEIVFQFTAKEYDLFSTEMIKSVTDGFGVFDVDTVEIQWGLAINPKDMKAEIGIYILANFK